MKHCFIHTDVEELFEKLPKLPKAQLTPEECDDMFVSIMDDIEVLQDRVKALEENNEMLLESMDAVEKVLTEIESLLLMSMKMEKRANTKAKK